MFQFKVWLLTLFICILVSQVVSATPGKHALLIAISNYPPETGWPKLHSNNDFEIMKRTLLGQGFLEKNIIGIQDKEATREGIVAKVEALLKVVKTGDQVVIHYSGHGQQIWDDNGDELDGLDECLVAYGAPMIISYDKYKGEKHIRDDEVNQWLDRLRTKVGSIGHVLVILDSCNSGTAGRGDLPSRGGPPILPDGKKVQVQVETETPGLLDTQATKGRSEKSLGRLILFSAASADQTDFETYSGDIAVGPLSDAFGRVFSRINPKATYRSLFAQIQNRMATTSRYQTPVLEGDADYEIFGGDMIIQKAYYEITREKDAEFVTNKEKGDTVLLKAGSLAGAGKGALIGFYKSGVATPDSSAFLAQGEVLVAGPFSAKVVINSGRLHQATQNIWAFITRQSYTDWSVNVSVDDNVPSTIRQMLTDSLKNQGVLRVVPVSKSQLRFKAGQGPLLLDLVQSADSIRLMKLIKGATPEIVVANALEQIRSYAIGQFLKEFDIPQNSKYKVSIRLSDVDPKISNQPPPLGKGNVPELLIGKPAWVTVRNEGEEAFYYNILDFQPDGIVGVTVPKRELYEPRELRLGKGECKTFAINITKPAGMEMNRVFVGAQPIDLRLAFGFFGARGAESPIERLLQSALGKTKGSSDLVFDPSSGGVASYTFKIVEK